jgi:(R,R)-butanediol dehydrogenase/meso-butanediol dehydrogenase/diacetyl reductase/L-iditol 2-dehydrogenase
MDKTNGRPTMKAVIVTKRGSLLDSDPERRGRMEIRDIPVRQVGPEDVKVRVAYCGICASDVLAFEGLFDRTPPFGIGHEISGTIVEVGPKATRRNLRVGDRVAGNFIKYCGTCYHCLNGEEHFCENGGFNFDKGMAEYVVWHESQAWKIPDDLPLEQACLLENVSVAVRIADKANMKVGKRVAILGGGPLGLQTLQLMKMFGATDLTISEPVENRRVLAKPFGAEHVLDPTVDDVVERAREITGGRGFDLIVEASGAPEAAVAAYQIAAPGATVLYIAGYPDGYLLPVPITELFGPKELIFSGVFRSPYTFPRAFQLMSKMDLEPLSRYIFPLDQAEEAVMAHVTRRHPKIILKCDGE